MMQRGRLFRFWNRACLNGALWLVNSLASFFANRQNSRLWSRAYQMVAQFGYKVMKSILFFMEVDESIDISGSPEKTYTLYGSGAEMPR